MQSNEPSLQAPSFSCFPLFELVSQRLVPEKIWRIIDEYDESHLNNHNITISQQSLGQVSTSGVHFPTFLQIFFK